MARSTDSPKSKYATLAPTNGKSKSLAEALDSHVMGELTIQVLKAGDAILWGMTKDGGALRVILMEGDTKVSHYHDDAEALTTWAEALTANLRKVTD
jgi:hypothetical protein